MTNKEFKETFLPLERKLFAVGYKIIKNKEDTRDILQDLFIKIWNKRDELNDIKNAEAYCVTILKHMCYDFLRSSKYHMDEEFIDRNSSKLRDEDLQKKVEDRDKVNIVKKIILKLPDKQRNVFILRDLKEYTFNEIEKHTGITNSNSRVLLSRARKYIRDNFNRINNDR